MAEIPGIRCPVRDSGPRPVLGENAPMNIPDSKLFQCQCMGEGVVLSWWDATPEEVPQVIVTVWHDASMGTGKWTWKTRVRAIWDIIRRGHVGYEYGVILDEGEALGLAEWLSTRPWPTLPRR